MILNGGLWAIAHVKGCLWTGKERIAKTDWKYLANCGRILSSLSQCLGFESSTTERMKQSDTIDATRRQLFENFHWNMQTFKTCWILKEFFCESTNKTWKMPFERLSLERIYKYVLTRVAQTAFSTFSFHSGKKNSSRIQQVLKVGTFEWKFSNKCISVASIVCTPLSNSSTN